MKSRKLHILHTEASCGWGGQEIRILTESSGMQARGHRVTIACPAQAPLFAEAQKRGLSAVALPIGRKNLTGFFAMRRWLKENPVDVINTHSSTDSWLAALARLGLRPRPALVRTRHISTPVSNNPATQWLYSSGTDFIVTTGERLRNTLIHDNRIPGRQVQSIATGIDPALIRPGDRAKAREALGLPLDKIIIGIVAAIRSWKGHEYLIEAIAQLQRPDVHLLIVGDGPNRANVEEAVARFNLQQQVTFTGNQSNVAPWLQALDLFVLPSYANEGVPQSILQAMLCKIPVISTTIGSIDEIVHDCQTGLLVPPKDAASLCAAIRRLLDNKSLSEELARAGNELALSDYTLEHMVSRMEAIFYRMLT